MRCWRKRKRRICCQPLTDRNYDINLSRLAGYTAPILKRRVSMKKDVYVECPTYETAHFVLRLVKEENADELFVCYTAPKPANSSMTTAEIMPMAMRIRLTVCVLSSAGGWTYMPRAGLCALPFWTGTKCRCRNYRDVWGRRGRAHRYSARIRNPDVPVGAYRQADSFFEDFQCGRIITIVFASSPQRTLALSTWICPLSGQ